MKKRFFPIGWRYWVVSIIYLIVFIPCTMIAIVGIICPLIIGKICILLFIGFPWYLSFMCILQMLTSTVVLTDEEIYTKGQMGWGKIQYPVKVKYVDIKKLGLRSTISDSRGKTSGGGRFSGTGCLFLRVYITEKKSKNILIDFFSVKQRRQIIDIINKNTKLDVSYDMLDNNKKGS